MAESIKKGVLEMIKDALRYVSQIVSASIFVPIVEGTEKVMENIEEKIIKIEKRIIRKVSSLLIIFCGGALLIFALFSILTEYFGWSNARSYFSIGITIFVIGLLLKIG